MSSLFDEPTAAMGGVNGRYVRLLQTGSNAATLAAGYRIEHGDGTATPLGLCADGIIIFSPAGFRSVIGSEALKARKQTIADGDGKLFPRIFTALAADVPSTTTAQTAVSGFNVALEANAFYHFELSLLVKVASSATGFQFALTGPPEADWLTYVASHISATGLATTNNRSQMLTVFGTTVALGDSPVASPSVFEIGVRGKIQMGSSAPSSQIGLTIASETNASQVTLMKYSAMTFEKRN